MDYFLEIPLYLVTFVFDPHCIIDGLNDYLNTYYESLRLNIDISKK